jgi:hypothetical protein
MDGEHHMSSLRFPKIAVSEEPRPREVRNIELDKILSLVQK